MGEATPESPSRDERFVRGLAKAHRAREATLSAARRWRPGIVDRRVIALTCLDAEPATAAEYPCWAQTAKLFAIWHGGRADPQYGYPGNGIGRWAHQVGVGDPAGERLIGRITTAATPLALDTALAALAGRRTPRPPHWASVLSELAAWSDPAQRDRVRFEWAHDFYSFARPAATAGTGADAATGPPAEASVAT